MQQIKYKRLDINGVSIAYREAGNAENALWEYAKRYGYRESYFLESLAHVGTGEGLSGKFWEDISLHGWSEMTFDERERKVAVFERNARTFFGEHTDFAEIYLQKCREE